MGLLSPTGKVRMKHIQENGMFPDFTDMADSVIPSPSSDHPDRTCGDSVPKAQFSERLCTHLTKDPKVEIRYYLCG